MQRWVRPAGCLSASRTTAYEAGESYAGGEGTAAEGLLDRMHAERRTCSLA